MIDTVTLTPTIVIRRFRREAAGEATQQLFKIRDIKLKRVAFSRLSEHEAHKRVDLLNSCGTVRYKAEPM